MDILVLEFVTCYILTTVFLMSQSVTALRERRPVNKRYQEPIEVLSLSNSDVTNLTAKYSKTSPENATRNYRNLVFSNDMSEIYAGTLDNLLIINTSDLDDVEEINFASSRCDSSSNPNTCHYVRLIQPLENDCLYVCYSDQPRAQCCFAWTNGTVREPCQSVSIAPEDTAQNFTVTYLKEERNLFIGVGVTSSTIQSDVEFRFDNLAKECEEVKRTVYADTGSKWINVPKFVGKPIEYGDYVYFFFREFASEAINGGRIAYSRIGRVCKNDPGGVDFTNLADKFTTYQKARLDCSFEVDPLEYPEKPGDAENKRTYDFNEIQGTYWINETKTIFAVFTNPRTSLEGSSAVCAYNLDEIADLFDNSQLLGQGDDKDLWTPKTRPAGVFQCDITAPTTTYDDLQDYPLMNSKVPNKLNYKGTSDYLRDSDAPLIVLDGVRFSQIVVNDDDVMYLGTERGTVIKAYLSDTNNEAILESEIDFNTDGLKEAPVLSMLKKDGENVVYIGTANSVYRLALDYREPVTTAMTPLATTPVEAEVVLTSGICQNFTTMIPMDDCNVTIPVNRTLSLHHSARTVEGANLRIENFECNSCIPFLSSFNNTTFLSSSNGQDVATLNLVLVTNQTTEGVCSCSAKFAAGTNERTLRTNITISDEAIIDIPDCVNGTQDYDNEIAKYKLDLTNWKNYLISMQPSSSSCDVDTYCYENTSGLCG